MLIATKNAKQLPSTLGSIDYWHPRDLSRVYIFQKGKDRRVVITFAKLAGNEQLKKI